MPSQAKRQRQKEGRRIRAEAIRAAQLREKRRKSAIRGAVGIVVIVGMFALVAKVSGGKKTNLSTSTSTSTSLDLPPRAKALAVGKTIKGETPCPKADGSSERTTKFEKAPPMCIDRAKTYTATFETSEGNIETTLDTTTTPNTANNFVVLARYHYFDGSSFYRTDTSIDIIQGGPATQFPPSGSKLPGYILKDEGSPPRHYTPGDLVVTRGSGPDSGGADIFFGAGPKVSNLDAQGTYVTFGHTKGEADLAVVAKILGLNKDDPTSSLGGGPKRVVTIKKITITES